MRVARWASMRSSPPVRLVKRADCGVSFSSRPEPRRGRTLPATIDERFEGRSFALGLGLTNACNLSCTFCYRDPTREDRLDLEQVRAVLGALPLRSVNLGTGENGMHP